MSNYVIVVESGADIPKELTEKYGIFVVPMHVSFGTITKNDGSFETIDVFNYYNETGTLPTTSGSSPNDFEIMFDKIHTMYPDKHILHLAYSAVTTCSYQSSIIASEHLDYVTVIDTKNVSAGQAIIVLEIAKFLEKEPNCTLEELISKTSELIQSAKMVFFPDTLVYLKAGGRVTNSKYLTAKLLNIKPLIEIKDGMLVSTKQYRGSMLLCTRKMIPDFIKRHRIKTESIVLLYSPGLSEEVKHEVSQTISAFGINTVLWIETGGVISTHGGPGAFGIVGFSSID